MTINPNSGQLIAIKHPPSPLMIIAGAGTGKTFTLQNRITYFIEKRKIKPENILAITYTEKASYELKNRIIKNVGKSAEKMTVSTFHSFCLKILRDYSDEKFPDLFEHSEAVHLLLSRFDELKPFQSDLFALNPQKAILNSILPFYSRIKDELIDIKTLSLDDLVKKKVINLELENQIKDLKRIYPKLQKWKKDLGVIDYGDMISLAYKLIISNKSALDSIRNQYKHIIIDEFQDNNYALNTIISLIVDAQNSITVVGDDDQVIYSFRGANSYNIQSFKNKYKSDPEFKIISLEQNYRSSQPILDVANITIKKNNDRINKVLFSEKKKTGNLPILFLGDLNSQNQFLIQSIKKIQDIKYNQIAVLCRTHNQCNKIYKLFKESGLPTNPVFPDFFGISIIRNILSWCQLIVGGPLCNIALYRILRNRLGYTKTNSIFEGIKNKRDNYLNQLELDNTLKEKFPEVQEILKEVEHYKSLLKKRSLDQMVWIITSNQDLIKKAAKRYSLYDQFILLNIGQLLIKSQEFSKRNKKLSTIWNFNTYIEAVMNSGSTSSLKPLKTNNLKGIIIKTVHSVKGGEFDVVFLPYQRSGSFPLNYRSNQFINKPLDEWLRYSESSTISSKEHHYEEERRLFYVALTRAKRKLFLLAPKKATSKFIKEIPIELMENKQMDEIGKEAIPSSKLKMKYEEFLQRALVDESYDEIKKISDVLIKIKQYENGKKVTFKNEYWDQKLQRDFQSNIVEPSIPEKLHLSASSIETYKTCPLKFRFNKIDKIPQNGSKPELIFGTIIHTVLQRFHKLGGELKKTRILDLLDQEWRKDDFDYEVREMKFKEQGIKILSQYVDYVISNPPKVLEREMSFSFDIKDVTIKGSIDRIDEDRNGVKIIDYKTSKIASSAKSSLQLAVYCLYLLQSSNEKIKGLPSKAVLHFLRDEENPIKEHSFNILELKSVEKVIEKTAKNIRDQEFSPKKGKHCDWCDYKNLLCPEWGD